MGRRLPPGEAERRAKLRRDAQWARMKSGEAYNKFNANDGIGHGSDTQYREQAERIVHGKITTTPNANADLVRLGLDEMPKDAKTLTRAYRAATLKAHPDAPGGSHAAFLELRKAYERLKERF